MVPAPTSLDQDKAALVGAVTQVAQRSFLHRKLWITFCDKHLCGTRDPAWHSKVVLSEFLQLAASLKDPDPTTRLSHDKLVGRLKQLMRSSRTVTQEWRAYCSRRRASCDCHVHSPESLKQFLGTVEKQPQKWIPKTAALQNGSQRLAIASLPRSRASMQTQWS